MLEPIEIENEFLQMIKNSNHYSMSKNTQLLDYLSEILTISFSVEQLGIIDYTVSETGKLFFKLLHDDLNEALKGVAKNLNFQYLTPFRANQQILHTTDNQKTDFSILLKTYIKLTNDRKDYVNQKIRTLLSFSGKTELIIKNLGENLQIEAYVAYLKDEKKETLLSNLGFGVTQLITLLMQIVVSEHGQTIIIEEPETNLHPKLQTQLAKLFIQAHKDFGIRFIIETHSEYLVRGLQLEVAKGLKADNLNMYYLNNLKQYPEKPQVEKIKFDNEGNIFNAENPEIKNENVFNSGFFDEATTLKDRLEQEQYIQSLKQKIQNTNIKCIVFNAT